MLLPLLGSLIVISCVHSAALPSNAQQQWTIGQPVDTSSGVVTGRHAPWPANSGVSEYLGIRYAQAPIGDLRFAAPKAYEGKGKQVDGTQWVSE